MELKRIESAPEMQAQVCGEILETMHAELATYTSNMNPPLAVSRNGLYACIMLVVRTLKHPTYHTCVVSSRLADGQCHYTGVRFIFSAPKERSPQKEESPAEVQVRFSPELVRRITLLFGEAVNTGQDPPLVYGRRGGGMGDARRTCMDVSLEGRDGGVALVLSFLDANQKTSADEPFGALPLAQTIPRRLCAALVERPFSMLKEGMDLVTAIANGEEVPMWHSMGSAGLRLGPFLSVGLYEAEALYLAANATGSDAQDVLVNHARSLPYGTMHPSSGSVMGGEVLFIELPQSMIGNSFSNSNFIPTPPPMPYYYRQNVYQQPQQGNHEAWRRKHDRYSPY